MTKPKPLIYFADLTHTSQGISAATFPLGIGFVVSHARKEFGGEFDFCLFKFPDALDRALTEAPPVMLCLSNYSWNCELAYTVSRLAKKRDPRIIIVFGGPNFPVMVDEKRSFLAAKPSIDFYVELEGELGFSALMRTLVAEDFDKAPLRARRDKITNCSYLVDGQLVAGPSQRINDINVVPSPYLTGILDEFFEFALAPMVETTRGCPFTCTFCADGIDLKSKVHRFEQARTREELTYITDRVRKSDELIITDLNFGMYQEDLQTSAAVAELQGTRNWPVIVKATAGKNKSERVMEVASMLKGSWVFGAAIQSYDQDVLKAIRRSNISTAAYEKFMDYSNNLSNDSQTYTEIILGLPGDTKHKHFESLRFGVRHHTNSLRMYQAMLLAGTEMDTKECREKYGLITRFRTIPGCVGIYRFFGEDHPVAEIEEIIVGSKDMPFEDYIECRIMNLVIETFYNNSLFEEIFGVIRAVGGDVFDCLLYVKDHSELYSPRIAEIIDEFVHQTSADVFDTREEAERFVLTPDVIGRYVGGELGINELLVHKALLFRELPQISELLVTAAKACLRDHDLLTGRVEHYIDELLRFIVQAKRDIHETDHVFADEFSYDFGEISAQKWMVDPRTLPAGAPRRYVFFHDDEQKRHIATQEAMYSSTPSGFGRVTARGRPHDSSTSAVTRTLLDFVKHGDFSAFGRNHTTWRLS